MPTSHPELENVPLHLRPSSNQYYLYKTGNTQYTRKMKFACKLKSAQCLYRRVRGNQRCKKRVVMGLGYCNDHLRKEMGVSIEDSSIEHAGKGLFAARPFEVGENPMVLPERCTETSSARCSLPYWGELLTGAEATRRYGTQTGNYALGKGDKTRRVVDAACFRSFGSFINHSRENPNVRFVTFDNTTPSIVVIRPIAAGEELLADYGRKYQLVSLRNEYSTLKGRMPDACPPDAARDCFVYS